MIQTNKLALRIAIQFIVASLIVIALFLLFTNRMLLLVIDPSVGSSVIASIQRLLTIQGVIIVFLMLGLLLLLIYRTILRPFSKLMQVAGEILRGNFNVEVTVEGKDELRDFAKSFSRMFNELKAREEEITRAQRGLEDSELKFRTITASALDAIVMVDNDGRVTYWNEAAEKTFGFREDEIIHHEIYKVLLPERYHQVFEDRFPDFKHDGGGGIFGKPIEMTALKKDGTELPIEISLSTVLLQGRWNATGILRDISKVKQDKSELTRYREQLEEMVMERTRELKEAQDELVNKAIEAGRAQLSAMILHNIGNALTPVSVQVEELMKDDHERLIGYLKKCYEDLTVKQDDLSIYVNEDSRGKEVFAFMGTLIQSLTEQVNANQSAIHKIFSAVSYMAEIISLQQSYAGSETLQLVNLNLLLEDSIRMQQSSLEKRRITIKQELDENLPLIKIDKNKLMQVIVNLIKNSYEAIDFIEDPTVDKQIMFRTFKEKEEVGFEVTDTGIGVDPEKIDGIFDFGESAKGSSGFGLYYSKMFVESNRGKLEFGSGGVGQGASIQIRFQRAQTGKNVQQDS